MRINKSILLVLILMSQFYQLGCRKKIDNEENVPPDQIEKRNGTSNNSNEYDLTDVAGEGVGSIWFGMSKEELVQAIGEPEEVAAKGRSLLYPSKGLSLFVSPTKGVQYINCYSKTAVPLNKEFQDFQGKTKEGIQIGADLSEILTAYGEPTKKDMTGPQMQLEYQELGITFLLLNDRLVQFMMSP
jgi:hypothetical protein